MKPVKQDKKVGSTSRVKMMRMAAAARAIRIPLSQILERDKQTQKV